MSPPKPRLTLAREARVALAAVLVALAGAGFAAHAGLNRSSLPTAPAAPPVATGYEAQDHFPGAALLEAIDDGAAPIRGVTGTIALPAGPAPLAEPEGVLADGTIRPARPFLLTGTPLSQSRALQCLTSAIYYEAASEPDDGQAAVAQVILNRVRHPAFPASVCGVVFQGSEHRGCQFSFACDGAMARVPMRVAWDRARRVAARALSGFVFAPVGLATHYHTYAVTPAWNRSLVMTGMFGAHLFHRWQGGWGTLAAFRQGYAGVEPEPGPHPPADAPIAPLSIATTLAAASASPLAPGSPQPTAPTPVSNIVPDKQASGTAIAGLADESQVLAKWKDAGKPLR